MTHRGGVARSPRAKAVHLCRGTSVRPDGPAGLIGDGRSGVVWEHLGDVPLLREAPPSVFNLIGLLIVGLIIYALYGYRNSHLGRGEVGTERET